ncbi:MAG: Smr/MutS family protein [Flavipsychrobacter sp.]
MKFSIGDKILVKETEEEGYILSFIGKDMAEVKVGKTTFPVYLDDIDHPYLKWFTDKKKKTTKGASLEQLPVEKQQQKRPRLARGVYLSFFPEFKIEEMEDVVDSLKVHLLNELPYEIQYQYSLNFAGATEFKHEGKLQAFGHVYLHAIPFDDMNDSPRFVWQVDNLEEPDMQPEEGVLKIKPQKLFLHIQDALANNKPSFSYLLFEDFKAFSKERFQLQERKQVKAQITTKVLAKEEPKYELDLHIEQLLPGYTSLTNSEIIDVQITELERYLRLAINNHQEYMVVIHGIGKGRLREEVHKVLAGIPEIFSYANEWHSKYGFGATEVKFKY